MDKFEMIKQFKDLLDNGVISQEEFDQKKKELLSIGDDIQPQAKVDPIVEESLDEVSAAEESEDEESTIEEKTVSEDLVEVVEPTETTEVAEPTDTVAVTEEESQVQTSAPEQAAASKKGKIIVGVAAAFVVLILIAILGSGGSSGIKGSWNCDSVTYMGETLTASEAQADDYTFKFTSNTFEANIYGAEASGTYEFSETVTLNDGTEADVYTLTTDGGAELTVAYFKSLKLLTLSPFGGVSESTYIAFKRR